MLVERLWGKVAPSIIGNNTSLHHAVLDPLHAKLDVVEVLALVPMVPQQHEGRNLGHFRDSLVQAGLSHQRSLLLLDLGSNKTIRALCSNVGIQVNKFGKKNRDMAHTISVSHHWVNWNMSRGWESHPL